MNSIRDKLLIRSILFLFYLLVAVSFWVLLRPSAIQGSGGFSSGVWTGYEKGEIIGLPRQIEKNTRGDR